MGTTVPYHAGMLLGRSVNMKTMQPSYMLVGDDPTEQKVNLTTCQFSCVKTLKDVCDVLSIPPEYALKVRARIKDVKNELVESCLEDLGKENQFTIIFKVTYLEQKQYLSPDVVLVDSDIPDGQVKSGESCHTTESLNAKTPADSESLTHKGGSSLPESLSGKSRGHHGTHWVKAIEIGNELVTVLTVSCKGSEKLKKLRKKFSKCLQADCGELDRHKMEDLSKLGRKIDKKLSKEKHADVFFDIQYGSFAELDKYPASMSGMVNTIDSFLDQCVGWTEISKHGTEFKIEPRVMRCQPGVNMDEKTKKDSLKQKFSSSSASSWGKVAYSNNETCETPSNSDTGDTDSFVIIDSRYLYNLRVTLQSLEKDNGVAGSSSSLGLEQYLQFENVFKQLVNCSEAMHIIQDFLSRHETHFDEGRNVIKSIENVHRLVLETVADLDFVCIPTENTIENVITTNPLTTVTDFIECVQIMYTTIPYHDGMLLGHSVNTMTMQPGYSLIGENINPREVKETLTTSRFSCVETLKDVCHILRIHPGYALKVMAGINDMKNKLVESCLEDLGKKNTFKFIFTVTFLERKQYLSPDVVRVSSDIPDEQVKSEENCHTTESLKAKTPADSESRIHDGDSPLPESLSGKSRGHRGTHWVKAIEIGNELVTVLTVSCKDSEKLNELKKTFLEYLKVNRGQLDIPLKDALKTLGRTIDKEISKKHNSDVCLDILYGSFIELDRYPSSMSGMVETIDSFMDHCVGWTERSNHGPGCEVQTSVMRCKPEVDKEDKTTRKTSLKQMFSNFNASRSGHKMTHPKKETSEKPTNSHDKDSFVTRYLHNLRVTLQPLEKDNGVAGSSSSLALGQSPQTKCTIFENIFKQLVDCTEAAYIIQEFLSSKRYLLETHCDEGRKVLHSIQKEHLLVLETVEDLDFVCIPTENTLKNVITTNPLTTVNDFIENVTSKLPPGSDIDLLMLGKTGHGKSSTGNSILGQNKFVFSSKSTSTTSHCGVGWVKIDGRIIKVVDTPGVCDTNNDPSSIDLAIQSISEAIANCPKGFHALLLLIRFGTKMTDEERKAIELLKHILGENIIKSHCIFVITHGDNFETEMAGTKTTFEKWCKDQDGVLKVLFEECDYRCVLFNNKATDPKVMKAQLIKLVAKVDSLKDRGTRYTNSLFELALSERQRIITEEMVPQVNEEMMRDMHLVLNFEDMDAVFKNANEIARFREDLSRLKETVDHLNNTVGATVNGELTFLAHALFDLLELLQENRVDGSPKPDNPGEPAGATPKNRVDGSPKPDNPGEPTGATPKNRAGGSPKPDNPGEPAGATPENRVDGSPKPDNPGEPARATPAEATPERAKSDLKKMNTLFEKIRRFFKKETIPVNEMVAVRVTEPVKEKVKEKKCFPGSSVVQLSNGKSATLEELCVGDKVLVRDKTGSLSFDTVYMFGHQELEASSEFLALKTASQTVYVTSGHYVYCVQDGTELCVAAEKVHVGDCLLVATGDGLVPQSVHAVTYERKRGLFAPFTNSGNIIIDGALMSCYIDVLPATMCHNLLWPVRQLYSVSPGVLSNLNGPPSQHPVPRWAKAALRLI